MNNKDKDNIKYERDVKYTDIDKFDYKGKMDCDYKIYINDKIWYVEMAGYLPRKGLPFEKWSSQEKNYFFKIRYKEKWIPEYQKLIKQTGLMAIKYKELTGYEMPIEEKMNGFVINF